MCCSSTRLSPSSSDQLGFPRRSRRPVSAGRVLIVDDDPSICRILEINLVARGYEVDVAADGRSAVDLAGRRPDLIVLDLGLPDIDGLEVIAGVRASSGVPIVVLSARDVTDTEEAALSAGADDYVAKPFNMGHLMARIRAAVRTSGLPGEHTIIVTPDFTIDLAAKRVIRYRRDVALTATQWHLVAVLVHNRGRIVSRRALLDEIWGPGQEHKIPYLEHFLAQIREKLEPDAARPTYFVSESDRGYRFSG